MDRERIAEKLGYLNEQGEAMGSLMGRRPDPTMDPWVMRGLRYAVHTAVEAMIDISYHVSAKGRAHVPSDAHDALDAAAQGTGTSGEQVRRWHDMIGLRNRLVYGYERVADERLCDEVRAGLGDFRAFMTLVEVWLREAGEGGAAPQDGGSESR